MNACHPLDISSLLKAIRVRPVEHHEQARWYELLAQHHYLGAPAKVGKTLLHVATLNEQWVALLGWSSPALKCAARDQWIGWLPVLQWQRLHFIANNNRFLILPDFHLPNLASRVLGLSLQRLGDDWQQLHGHPLLLAETFVDPARFNGTCYRAAGWQALGQTKGFSKNATRYWHHGQPKIVFIKPLRSQARQWLSDLVPDPSWRCPVTTLTLSIPHTESLRQHLTTIPECRKRMGLRHPLQSVLLIAICAILGGSRSYLAISQWAKRSSQAMRRRFRCRLNDATNRFEAPSEPTIRRVLREVDAQAVDDVLGQWLLSLSDPDDPIAIDGKALRGAKQENGKPVHLLSAFLHRQGSTLAQIPIADKSNEITAVRPLLTNLALAGRLITADAIHAQKNY
ncbi:MAG: ISAs1 family transposase [Magnetococcus sp. YQC-5]